MKKFSNSTYNNKRGRKQISTYSKMLMEKYFNPVMGEDN